MRHLRWYRECGRDCARGRQLDLPGMRQSPFQGQPTGWQPTGCMHSEARAAPAAAFATGGSCGILLAMKEKFSGRKCMRRICARLAAMAFAAAVPALACAQDMPDLRAPDLRQPAGAEWPAIGGDWSNSRYSTLTEINRDNVKNLKGAWVVHLGSGLSPKYSLEGTPVVKDGVLYVSTGNDDVYAFDAKTGALIWEHRSGIDQNITTVCCGWDNRGVAVADGKVFLGLLDGSLVALDAKTGDLIWQTQVGKWQDGYTITSAPLYYNGVIYSGISGGDREARGKLTALDARSGKELWHWWTVPAPGEFGGDTWPSPDDPDPIRANAYLHGGANVWNTPAVDPELGLIY